jgi:fatty acid/phospholipid biosynthesis enzyme
MKKYQLPKEFTKKWLTALRSGKFKQTQEELYNKNTGGFCCLGVACVVAGHTKNIKKYGYEGYISAKTSSGLPVFRKIPAQLRGEDNRLAKHLASLNDNDNYAFSEIADWIEKNVKLI